MNFNEDLQEKYKDHQVANLGDKVPLAADAAHLISEYLDTLAVEFVKQGISEPYSIANQYEEMILNSLREQAGDKKITIEVVEKILDQFGAPQKAVLDYIKQNQPKRELILSKTPAETSRKRLDFERDNIHDRRGGVRDLIFSIPYLGYASLIVLTVFFTIDGFIQVREFPIRYAYSPLLVISIIAAFLELVSGVTGQNLISISHYKIYRKILTTELWYCSLILGLRAYEFLGTLSSDIIYFLIPPVIYHGVILLRDHGPGFYPIEPEFREWIRYFTPSYILFGISTAGVVLFYHLFDNPLIYNGSIFLMIVFLVLGMSSVVLDFIQNYPVSLRKNIFLTLHLVFFYFFMSKMEVGLAYSGNPFLIVLDVNYYKIDLTSFIFFTWIAIFVVLMFLIYQNLFRSQLEEYRFRLQEYSM